MRGLWIALVWLVGVNLSPALAELYRWTDDAGKVHITDDPATIPPAYRDRARASSSAPPVSGAAAPAPAPDVEAPPAAPGPSGWPEPTAAPARDSAPPSTRSIQDLQQQIATARQQRQTYLTQLRNERAVHTTPVLVRQRRHIAETVQALLTVEQRLDTLQAALERAQQQLRARQAPAPGQSTTGVDNAGHTAAYWQRRLTEARDRLRQAQAQRRDSLARLAAAVVDGQRIATGQGRDILQEAEALAHAHQDIDAAEAAIQALHREALQSGAPAAWLQ